MTDPRRLHISLTTDNDVQNVWLLPVYHTWTKRKKHKSMCKTFMLVLASTTQPKARKKLWNWSFCGSLCGSPSASLMPGSFAGPGKTVLGTVGTCCAIQWFQHRRGHFQVSSYYLILVSIGNYQIYSDLTFKQFQTWGCDKMVKQSIAIWSVAVKHILDTASASAYQAHVNHLRFQLKANRVKRQRTVVAWPSAQHMISESLVFDYTLNAWNLADTIVWFGLGDHRKNAHWPKRTMPTDPNVPIVSCTCIVILFEDSAIEETQYKPADFAFPWWYSLKEQNAGRWKKKWLS